MEEAELGLWRRVDLFPPNLGSGTHMVARQGLTAVGFSKLAAVRAPHVCPSIRVALDTFSRGAPAARGEAEGPVLWIANSGLSLSETGEGAWAAVAQMTPWRLGKAKTSLMI